MENMVLEIVGKTTTTGNTTSGTSTSTVYADPSSPDGVITTSKGTIAANGSSITFTGTGQYADTSGAATVDDEYGSAITLTFTYNSTEHTVQMRMLGGYTSDFTTNGVSPIGKWTGSKIDTIIAYDSATKYFTYTSTIKTDDFGYPVGAKSIGKIVSGDIYKYCVQERFQESATASPVPSKFVYKVYLMGIQDTTNQMTYKHYMPGQADPIVEDTLTRQ
jgi:hypothetical protein